MKPIHTIPEWKDEPQHEDKATCWCQPQLRQICPVCDDNYVEGISTCFNCGGKGWVTPVLPSDAEHIVHNNLTPEPAFE